MPASEVFACGISMTKAVGDVFEWKLPSCCDELVPLMLMLALCCRHCLGPPG